MERHSRRCIPRGVVIFSVAVARFSQKVFFSAISLGLVGSLARQHWERHGQPSQFSQQYHAVETNCPSCTSVHSRRRNSRRPCTQIKQSSSWSYSMFSTRPTCFLNFLLRRCS